MRIVYVKFNDYNEAQQRLQETNNIGYGSLSCQLWECNQNGVPNEIRLFFNDAGKTDFSPLDYPYPSDIERIASLLHPTEMYCEGVKIWPR